MYVRTCIDVQGIDGIARAGSYMYMTCVQKKHASNTRVGNFSASVWCLCEYQEYEAWIICQDEWFDFILGKLGAHILEWDCLFFKNNRNFPRTGNDVWYQDMGDMNYEVHEGNAVNWLWSTSKRVRKAAILSVVVTGMVAVSSVLLSICQCDSSDTPHSKPS